MAAIYLDYAATAPIRPQVRRAMQSFLGDAFGNPSSVYALGGDAHEALASARTSVARLVGVAPDRILFTSGGTEAINLALQGVALARRGTGHLVTSAIEHPATLETARFLESRGWGVSYLPVDGNGRVDPDDLRRAITPATVLVSLMHANNEVGTIQPLAEVAGIVQEAGILLHVDAVQSAGKIPLQAAELGIDLLSISAHKLGGPKGVGALYVRAGVDLSPLIHGGGQEGGLRSGTENVAGIVGFGAAAEIAARGQAEERERIASLRDRLTDGILYTATGARLMGHPKLRLPGFAHFCFEGLDGHWLAKELSRAGIYAATGSACSSGKTEPSHVLRAMGVPAETARGALRLTLGWQTTADDVREAIVVIPQAAERLRRAAKSGVDLASEYARDCRTARRQALGRMMGDAISKLVHHKD